MWHATFWMYVPIESVSTESATQLNPTKPFSTQVWFQNRRAKWRRQEKLDMSENSEDESAPTDNPSQNPGCTTLGFVNSIANPGLFAPNLDHWMGYKLLSGYQPEPFGGSASSYMSASVGMLENAGHGNRLQLQDTLLQSANALPPAPSSYAIQNMQASNMPFPNYSSFMWSQSIRRW